MTYGTMVDLDIYPSLEQWALVCLERHRAWEVHVHQGVVASVTVTALHC